MAAAFCDPSRICSVIMSQAKFSERIVSCLLGSNMSFQSWDWQMKNKVISESILRSSPLLRTIETEFPAWEHFASLLGLFLLTLAVFQVF